VDEKGEHQRRASLLLISDKATKKPLEKSSGFFILPALKRRVFL
jgi:hypothetical protein